MFIKEKPATEETQMRYRVSTPRVNSPSFTSAELKYIHDTLKSDPSLNHFWHQRWIDALFSPIGINDGIDNTEFITKINSLITTHYTIDIVALIKEGLLNVNFESPTIKPDWLAIFNGGGNWNTGTIIDAVSQKLNSPNLLVRHITERTSQTSSTNTIPTPMDEIIKISKDEVIKILGKYGFSETNPEDVLNINAFSDLKNYLNPSDSTQTIIRFGNIESEVLKRAHRNANIASLVDNTSFKEEALKEIQAELTRSGRLNELVYKGLAAALGDTLTHSPPATVASIQTKTAEILTGRSEITYDDLKTIVTGIDNVFNPRPEYKKNTKYVLRYTDSTKRNVVIDFKFVTPGTTSEQIVYTTQPISVLTTQPIVKTAWDLFVAQLATHQPFSATFNEAEIVSTLSHIHDPRELMQLINKGEFEISASEFNSLTRYGIDFQNIINSAISSQSDPNVSCHVKITAKLVQTSETSDKKLVLAVHFVDDNAPTGTMDEEFVYGQEISSVNIDVMTFLDKLKANLDEYGKTHSFDLKILREQITSFTPSATGTNISRWFFENLENYKYIVSELSKYGSIVGGLTGLQSDRMHFEFKALEYTNGGSYLHAKLIITDTTVGSLMVNGKMEPYRFEQDVNIKVEDFADVQNSHVRRGIEGMLSHIIGKYNSKFNRNTWGSSRDDVIKPSTDADGERELNDMIDTMSPFLNPFDGTITVNSFSGIVKSIKDAGNELTWGNQIEEDADGNLGIWFTYTVNYESDVFSSTPTTSQRSFRVFSKLEYKEATNAQVDAAKSEISAAGTALVDQVRAFPGMDPAIVLGIGAEVAKIVSTYNDTPNAFLNTPNISEGSVFQLKKMALNEIEKLKETLSIGAGVLLGQPWFKKLYDLMGGNIPKDILDAIMKNPKIFEAMINQGESLDTILAIARNKKLMNELSKLNINTLTKAINTLKDVHSNYKYTYFGLGVAAGIGGVLAGSLAVNSIATARKAKKMKNINVRMRGTKTVALISTIVGLLASGSSAAFMVMFFVNKGGF